MPDEFNTKRICRMVDWSAAHGLIHSHKVKPHKPNAEDEHHYCSSFMANPKLRSLLPVPPLAQRQDDSIWLRDEYGRRKMLPDTAEVRRMREVRDAHNALMANTKIELAGYHHIDGMKYRLELIDEDGNPYDCDVYTANIAGHRIFNETFEQGGRIYGPWPQSIPMKGNPIRRNLLINGEPVIEQDFNAHHLRMLYAWVGVEMTLDPYSVPGFERDVCKLAMLIVINANTLRGAIQALVSNKKLKLD
jgi:hypothetical protein